MKNLILIFVAFLYFNVSCAQKNPFPVVNKDKMKAGELISIQGVSKNKYYKGYPKKITTTFGTIAVSENRTKEDSRLITLPVMKLHSSSNTPKEPVFLLLGGPGNPNIQTIPLFVWLLENHDVIMVGYRGVDGEVSLHSPEISETMPTEGAPFGGENLQEIAAGSLNAYNRLKGEGVDVDAYNIIEVIDDIETARIALGYKKINLLSISYGTHLAYSYGLKYSESLHRTLMIGVLTPELTTAEQEQKMIDSVFIYLGEQWKNNPECVAKCPDIIQSIQDQLNALPRKYKKITINPDKVRLMMFINASTPKGIAKIFDAFVAAENGDYSGLAFLSMAYDQISMTDRMNWGDIISKYACANYDAHRDYSKVMHSKDFVIDSPWSKLYGITSLGGWPASLIPEEYRGFHYSDAEILILSGNIDLITPAKNATKMLEYLPNAHQLIFSDQGHNLESLENDVKPMINTFYQTGEIDTSGLDFKPINFNDISPNFQFTGKIYYVLKRLHIMK